MTSSIRSIASGLGGKDRYTLSSAAKVSHSLRTMAGQQLKYPCTRTGGNRRLVLAASSNRAATSSIVHLVIALPSVEPVTDASHDLALDEVQTFVGCVDHQDVLVTPATFLDRIQIRGLRLQTTEGAAVLGCRHLHVTPPASRQPSAARPGRRLRCRRQGCDHAGGRTRSCRPCPHCPCRSRAS